MVGIDHHDHLNFRAKIEKLPFSIPSRTSSSNDKIDGKICNEEKKFVKIVSKYQIRKSVLVFQLKPINIFAFSLGR